MTSRRLRVSRFLIVPLTLALVALSVGVPMVAAKSGGNSANAKLCQKGGYVNYVDASGTIFTSAEACTSFAAQNGYLTPKPTFQGVCESDGGTFQASYYADFIASTLAPACLWTGADLGTWASADEDLSAVCSALGLTIVGAWFNFADPDYLGCV